MRSLKKLKKSDIICLIIAALSFVLMAVHAGNRSLWLDDLMTMLYVRKGVSPLGSLWLMLRDSGDNPPGFYFLAYIWFRIAPWGTFWIKLPNLIFTAIGVYVCGMAATKLKSGRAGILAALLAGTSTFLIRESSGFRPYGLLFMAVSLLIWCWIWRLEEAGHERRRMIILYGLAMTTLIYTHYFGCLAVAVIACGDMYLLIKKRVSWKILISYGMAGILYLPYLIYALPKIGGGDLDNKWTALPTVQKMYDVVMTAFGDHELLLVFFLFAVAVLVAWRLLLTTLREEIVDKQSRFICLVLAAVVLVTFGFGGIGSSYFAIGTKLLWTRYYISILPMIMLLTAIGMDMVYDALIGRHFPLLFTLLALFFGVRAFVEVNIWSHTLAEPNEQAIEWIYSQADAHDPGTIMLLPDAPFLDYYHTHAGRRPPMQVADADTMDVVFEDRWERLYRYDAYGGSAASLSERLETEWELLDEALGGWVKVYGRRP